MSENPPAKPRKRRYRLLAGIVVLAVAAWLIHPALLSRGLREILERTAVSQGLTVSIGQVDARIGQAVKLEKIRLESKETRVDIGLVEIVLTNPLTWFEKSARWIQRVRIAEGEGDFHAGDFTGGSSSDEPPDVRWLPREIQLEGLTGSWVDVDQSFFVRSLGVTLSEQSEGRLEAAELGLRSGAWSKTLGPLSGQTSWKAGTISLGGVKIQEGVQLDNATVDLLQSGGAAASFRASLFGGSLRGDLKLGKVVEAAFWSANIPLDQLPALAGFRERMSGRLVEGRLTFRGDPARPADAEASLRLVAAGFRWNDRGWESLEVGASLIHRRLVVTNFDLRQKENRVNFNGEVSLAEGFKEIAKAPFLLNVNADIKELESLGGLLGDPKGDLTGRMTAAGALSGREGQLEGYLSVESSGIRYRSLPETSLKLEAVFRRKEAEIAKLEINSGKDRVGVRGTVGIAAPHTYAAEVEGRIADLAAYLRPFRAPGTTVVSSGSLAGKWQGDGTWNAHSGAFDIQLANLVSDATPGGLSGAFTGTYSPQNLYFSKFTLEKGPLRLNSRATVASAGITVQDLELHGGQNLLLEGAAYLPLNVFAALGNGDWQAAIDAESETYVRLVTPRELNLQDLFRLSGQESPALGFLRINLESGGRPAQLRANGQLAVTRIRTAAAQNLPESTLDLQLKAADGTASMEGTLATAGFRPMNIKVTMPFGLARGENGTWSWINPAGTFDALAEFPKTDVSVFRQFLPPARRLSGEISGRVVASGTIANPQATGRIDLRNGTYEVSTRTPALTNLNASVVFDGRRATIESFRGEIGAGPLTMTGGVAFEGPVYDVKLKGEKILLARDAGVRLRANVDLALAGGPGGGSLTGSVRLVDGRIYQRLEITPLLVPMPGEEAPTLASPIAPGTVPAPFSQWALNVKLVNETPFLLKGNIADGEIIPDITFTGTLGSPVPVGRIRLSEVRAFLPFTTMTIPDGRIDFLPDAPWVPMLDIRGSAPMPGYEIQAFVFGPMNENKMILRSEPPLPQEALVLLLTAGIAPGATGGAAFGDAAIGQGGLLVLRSLAREFHVPGIDLDEIVNRFNISSTPAQAPGEATSLRGTFRLWDQLDLMTGRDGYGFYQAGVTYTWRFR